MASTTSMKRQGLAVALGAGLLLGLASQADAAKSMASNQVKISGCVYYPVQFCPKIKAGNTVYVLRGAKPSIPNNTGVRVIGIKTGTTDICFGTKLKVLRWQRIRLHCPK